MFSVVIINVETFQEFSLYYALLASSFPVKMEK